MVSRLHAGHAFTDLHDDTGPFVAENHGENALRIVPGEGKGIGMADSGVGVFNQYLAFFGGGNVNFNNLQRHSWRKCNGGT